MTERIGIYGGTFDPPHIGHQILAAEAIEQLELNRVLWVLTPDPPHKQGKTITPLSIRLEMVSAAIKDCPDFELSRIEIDRPPPHYAIDTLRLLLAHQPDRRLIYIMGGDSLHDLFQWHKYEEFVRICHGFGVMRRPGDKIDLDELESAIPGLRGKVQFIDGPLLEISATQIRRKIKSGRSFRYYLPPAVFQVVQSNALYQ